MTLGSPGLTDGYDNPELVRQINKTLPGMAFWAASGPFGTQCEGCVFYGYNRTVRNKFGDVVRTAFRRNGCGKFYKLTNRHGSSVPPGTESCRYYEPRSEA